MPAHDSALDPQAMQTARRLLSPDRRRERLWPTLAAAAALTLSSLAFALAMVLAPPAVTEHVARTAPG
jgi:hypothetical protein